jgi:hypothetical protein
MVPTDIFWKFLEQVRKSYEGKAKYFLRFSDVNCQEITADAGPATTHREL